MTDAKQLQFRVSGKGKDVVNSRISSTAKEVTVDITYKSDLDGRPREVQLVIPAPLLFSMLVYAE